MQKKYLSTHLKIELVVASLGKGECMKMITL